MTTNQDDRPRTPTPVPAPPMIGDGIAATGDPVLGFMTDDQLRVVFARIELIDQHQDACCGHERDVCRYDDDYERLYDVLHLAGVPRWSASFDRAAFEAWLADRDPPAADRREAAAGRRTAQDRS